MRLMTIKLFLSQSDSRPMYVQIMAQIKQKVMVGDWPSGFHLPSIREMASSIGVSVITVKRAYMELEREKVIYTQQGKGSFIAEVDTMQSELRYQELDSKLKEAVEAGKQLGLTAEELQLRLISLLEDER
jgi:GntR family transcriptional regulator